MNIPFALPGCSVECLPEESPGRLVIQVAKVSLREQWIGCKAQDDEGRVRMLVAEQDRDALYRFFIDHMGPCAMIDPGTVGTVEQSSAKGTLCMRPPGQPYCLWVPSSNQDEQIPQNFVTGPF